MVYGVPHIASAGLPVVERRRHFDPRMTGEDAELGMRLAESGGTVMGGEIECRTVCVQC
jgi:hypothetical protein